MRSSLRFFSFFDCLRWSNCRTKMLRHTLFFPFHGAGHSELKARSVDGFHLRMVTEEWSRVNRSPAWQDGVSYALAAAYGLVATVALVQLIRIQLRVPEYGWTTQKVFHLLNFLVNGVRATVFIFRRNIQYLTPKIFQSILLDLPGMLFFTTYTLLILFWAEIYYQVKNVPIDKLRPAFIGINAAAYTFQIVIWILELWISSPVLETVSKFTFAGISLCAALGFLLYGGRLHAMLRRFPVESKGRHKKLQEVGCVTAICFTCFILRAFLIAFSAIDKKADLDVLSHPILNAIYYMLVEILPSAFILFILRKLPPKRGSHQYHAIH